MNVDLQNALDEYVLIMAASYHADIYDAHRREAKAWQRCVVLGATRDDQTAAMQRVGR